jgi:hypothetical protein
VDDTTNPKQLVVEGHDDLSAISSLMRGYVDWPQGKDAKEKAPVYIHIGNGAEEILREEFLSVFLKGPTLKIAGVVLDADSKPRGRYGRIRSLCLNQFPDLPPDLPADGLVIENSQKKRFGVWIMPDNTSEGSIETFLKWLIPEQKEPTWIYAQQCVEAARRMGCKCKDNHLEKANLYSWLAWQDPPGQSPGVAIAKKILDGQSQSASSFVAWFKNLYQLPQKTTLFS